MGLKLPPDPLWTAVGTLLLTAFLYIIALGAGYTDLHHLCTVPRSARLAVSFGVACLTMFVLLVGAGK